MANLTNSEILAAILRSLYAVAGRRTTKNFAATVIGSIIKTLQQRYDFLKYVRINEKGELIEDEAIAISPEIDSVDPQRIGRAIEAIVRVVYMDLIGKAGLFFITELKKRAGEKVISELRNFDVDLATLQIEQHYLHRSRERKKDKKGRSSDVSLLGYSWKNVTSWKYDPHQKTCVLYNKDGEVLDNLHLETIIEDYVKDLSKSPEDLPEELEEMGGIGDKELQLIEMLRSRDMDAETAMVLLRVSKDEFNAIIKKLLQNDLLQYTSYNIVELTEVGVSYISKIEGKKNTGKKLVSEEIKKKI